MNFINYHGTPTWRRGRPPNPLFSSFTVKLTTLFVSTRSCTISTHFSDDSGFDFCLTYCRDTELTGRPKERMKSRSPLSETEAAAPKLNSKSMWGGFDSNSFPNMLNWLSQSCQLFSSSESRLDTTKVLSDKEQRSEPVCNPTIIYNTNGNTSVNVLLKAHNKLYKINYTQYTFLSLSLLVLYSACVIYLVSNVLLSVLCLIIHYIEKQRVCSLHIFDNKRHTPFYDRFRRVIANENIPRTRLIDFKSITIPFYQKLNIISLIINSFYMSCLYFQLIHRCKRSETEGTPKSRCPEWDSIPPSLGQPGERRILGLRATEPVEEKEHLQLYIDASRYQPLPLSPLRTGPTPLHSVHSAKGSTRSDLKHALPIQGLPHGTPHPQKDLPQSTPHHLKDLSECTPHRI